ncbi:amino acid adenylation domain-containing protein [Streptomyces sp. NPDC046727]|uniref:amino acid adenylation domain-containing protein n=1 Tax=Streptomyces sp. NPDC046727 TaxID=3155373 RepID=UPI0033E32675
MTTVHAPLLGAGFRRHAADAPDRPALVVGGRILSYGECDDIARRWAARLVDAAGRRVVRVGVFGHRSRTSYLGVLAALRAGAGFVPLNPRFPVRRTRDMMERAELDAIIADDAAAEQLPELLAGLARPPAVLLPGSARPELPGVRLMSGTDLAAAAPLADPVTAGPDDLAYLLFTSGSTGAPKGVPITHGNARAFLDHNQQRYGIEPADRFSQTFEQTFDLSVFDLFMAWEHGAAVCAMDPIELISPARYLERNEVTVWFSVPSVAAVLRKRDALRPGSMPTLRWSLFCGEPLPRASAEAWQAAAPHSTVENLYGPTELTIACAVHRWDPVVSPGLCVHDNVPIGQPYPGLHPLVVDEALRPVGDGAVGELCVAGPQTTPGYWRAPELTAERFFDRAGRRYYRTGDLVRRAGTEYVCLGRNDQQIKVGGHRIEPGEIEAALRRAGSVEAVCLLWPDESTFTAVVSGTTRTPAQLIEAVAARLPAYMVPRSVHTVDRMPLNSNGKIDRHALRAWLRERGSARRQGSAAAAETDISSVEELIAGTLDLPLDQVTDGLEYQSVRQWDSLGHVALMVALENAYGRPTDDGLPLDLRSVPAIRKYADRRPPYTAPAGTRAPHGTPAGEAPAGDTPAGETPDRETPARDVPAGKTSVGERPDRDVPAQDTPAQDTPLQDPPAREATPRETTPRRPTVRRGLEGIAFDRTEITHINGGAGVLEYRGYSIHDLVEHAAYEDVAHLLVDGELPDATARDAFRKELAAGRSVPPPVLDLLRSLRHAHPMDALLTAVPALQAYGPARTGGEDESHEQARVAGVGLIAAVPMLVAAHHAYRSGREFAAPPEHLSHAEASLTALLGTEPTPAAVRFVDKGFVVHADHGSNASAFVARVTTGCRAGMNASVTAAIAAFAGSVHGGAAERAVTLVDRVGAPEHAERYVAQTLRRNEPVMGFGHRVYRTEDPRVRHLRDTVRELSRERGDDSGLRVLDAVAAAMAPYRRHGLAPNVDLYAGLAYRMLGLPDDMAVPMFVIGRIAGWVAQVLEQHRNNVLIRPLLEYVGPRHRAFPGSGAQR